MFAGGSFLFAFALGRADFGDFSGGSDYGGSSDSYSGGYSGSDYRDSYDDDADAPSVIVGAVVVVVLLIIGACSKKGKSGASPAGAKPVDASTLEPVSALANFSESEFTGKLSNMYVRLQEAWAAGDLKPVEPLLTAPYYAQMAAQLKRDFTDKGIFPAIWST